MSLVVRGPPTKALICREIETASKFKDIVALDRIRGESGKPRRHSDQVESCIVHTMQWVYDALGVIGTRVYRVRMSM